MVRYPYCLFNFKNSLSFYFILLNSSIHFYAGAKTATPEEGSNANICPLGHYCRVKTTEPLKCPIRTLGLSTKLADISQCTPCPAGKYCDTPGKFNYTALCDKQFYCPNGSSSAQEVECPAGRYCPEGSPLPLLCPRGTFSNTTRLSDVSQCTNCTAGSFCMEDGLTSPSGLCRKGFYCPKGSKVDNPIECPIGLHCPEGMFFVCFRSMFWWERFRWMVFCDLRQFTIWFEKMICLISSYLVIRALWLFDSFLITDTLSFTEASDNCIWRTKEKEENAFVKKRVQSGRFCANWQDHHIRKTLMDKRNLRVVWTILTNQFDFFPLLCQLF